MFHILNVILITGIVVNDHSVVYRTGGFPYQRESVTVHSSRYDYNIVNYKKNFLHP